MPAEPASIALGVGSTILGFFGQKSASCVGFKLYHSSRYITISSALYTRILLLPTAGAVLKVIKFLTILYELLSCKTSSTSTLTLVRFTGSYVKSNVSVVPSQLRVLNSLEGVLRVILGKAPVVSTVYAVLATLLIFTFI